MTENSKDTDATKAEAGGPIEKAVASLADSTLKPLAGGAAITEGAGYPAQLIALSMIDNLVSSLVITLKDAGAQRIMIVEDRALLDSDWLYSAALALTARAEASLATADTLLDNLGAPATQAPPQGDDERDVPDSGDSTRSAASSLIGAVAPIAFALPKILGAVADIRGLFRTRYTFTAATISASGTPLIAEVAGTLAKQLPGAELMVDGFGGVPEDSAIIARWTAIDVSYQRVVQRTVSLRSASAHGAAKIAALEASRDAFHAAVVKAVAAGENPVELDRRVALLDAELDDERAKISSTDTALALVDAALVEATAAADQLVAGTDGDRPPLLAAVAREELHKEGSPTHVLFVSLDSIGGDIATPESAMKNPQHLLYLGGAAFSFMIYNTTRRRVVAAGTRRLAKLAKLELGSGTLTIDREIDFR